MFAASAQKISVDFWRQSLNVGIAIFYRFCSLSRYYFLTPSWKQALTLLLDILVCTGKRAVCLALSAKRHGPLQRGRVLEVPSLVEQGLVVFPSRSEDPIAKLIEDIRS